VRGKPKSRSSGRRSARTSRAGKGQSRLTSAATIIKEDAPPYRVAADVSPWQTSAAEKSAALSPTQPRFIDLFCGIGGFRLAFERAGGQCVFSSDWNEQAQITYEANHGERPHGDIHTAAVADIPAHDILCAGFPCQPFSIAGVSKKLSLGKKHGFEDKEQGNLFFTLADIIDYHRPTAFVLENVKNLRSHDQGRTFQVIHDTLTKALGYTVYYQVIDARSVVPQHRERIFLVGFKERRGFEFPEFPAEGPKLETILEDNVPEKYTLTD
jgi:DNA (cytosine-5)-methyltransferase 1